MAYLNVRDRRIETKIAYVGPELAGKGTNLDALVADATRGRATDRQEVTEPGGRRVSLEWVSLGLRRFNDCAVSAKVVAARGALSSQRLDDLFEDVDGVVVVIDAAPAAQDENRRAVSLVRDALAKESATRRSVVVQLNKSDVAGALVAGDLASKLEIGEWPVVTASAVRGEGVVETLEMALTGVIDGMAESNEPAEAVIDKNPLLTALRQVLRETVTEQMTAFEAEATARMLAASQAKFDDAVVRRLEQTDRGVAELRALIGNVRAELGSLRVELGNVRAESLAGARSDREHLTSIAAVLRRSVEGIAIDVKKQDAREQETHVKIAGVATKLEALDALATLDAKTDALRRDLREMMGPIAVRVARVDDSVQIMHVDAGESFARSEARLGELQSGLGELLEELKRRKKGGWFS